MAAVAVIESLTNQARRTEIEACYATLATRSDAEMLDLEPGASSAEIKAAFIAAARRFHPDTVSADESELRSRLQSIFVRVTEAHRNLRRGRGAVLPPSPPAPEKRLPPVPPPRQRASTPAAPSAVERNARVQRALAAAVDLLEEGRLEEAASVLHEVLIQADEPGRRRIRLLLARAYADDGRKRRHAVAFLRELVAQNAKDGEALCALGEIYSREGLLSLAERMFLRARAVDPGFAQARAGLRDVRAAIVATRPPVEQRPRRLGFFRRLLSVAR